MKAKIKLVFHGLILALAYAALPQVSEVAVAQEPQPATAEAVLDRRRPRGPVAEAGVGQWSPALTGERHPLYRLHKSDVLDIKFAFEPEFDQVVSVQPDGFIALKGVTELYVEGMRIPELQEAILKAYLPVLRDPEINIF